MSRGTKVVLRYAPQASKGTIPVIGWKDLPRKSDSLNNSVEMTDSETITDSRVKTAGLLTSATAEGDVECEFIKGSYDDLIAAAAGSEWIDDVLTFGGDLEPAFAIEKAHNDIQLYHLWEMMKVNAFTLDIPESGYISTTFGFMGIGYENAETIFSTGSAVAITSPKATALTVGDIKIDGSTLQGIACVTAFSFELTNNMEKQECLGSGLYGGSVLAMMADMSGSMTLAYSRKAQEILNKQLTGQYVTIEATINFGEGTDSYILRIPKAQITGDIPSGGKDKLDAALTYSVYADLPADRPTLTRVL